MNVLKQNRAATATANGRAKEKNWEKAFDRTSIITVKHIETWY